MTENIETLNSENEKNQTSDYMKDEESKSKSEKSFTKNTIFILVTIIILLSSFFISAIIASKNYEAIFNYLKEKVF